jgi:hypothetical protein
MYSYKFKLCRRICAKLSAHHIPWWPSNLQYRSYVQALKIWEIIARAIPGILCMNNQWEKYELFHTPLGSRISFAHGTGIQIRTQLLPCLPIKIWDPDYSGQIKYKSQRLHTMMFQFFLPEKNKEKYISDCRSSLLCMPVMSTLTTNDLEDLQENTYRYWKELKNTDVTCV